jgi:type II secretory pathway component PulF
MGWITAIPTNGLAGKALGLILTTMTIALFIVNLRRAGERAGRLAERLSTSEKTHEIQRQMLEAANRRPADRDALADRLRHGRF